MEPAPASSRAVVIVPMPDAEPAVQPWRDRHTVAGRLGMPAHVTLLPIWDAGADGVPAGARDALRAAVASQPAFTSRLDTVERWGEELVVLRPEDDAPYQALRDAVDGAVPGRPAREHPFRPHVTAGMASHGADLDVVENSVRTRPRPVADVTEAWLMEREDRPGARWELVESFPLGGPEAR